jgi:transposase
MRIIGCDFHLGYQQIAVSNSVTGEVVEKALGHERKEEVRTFASYLGLIPSEYSSGGRKQRLGHISKQGNPFLRGLLVEAAQSAVRYEPEMRRAYQRSAQRKCRGLAKVAMARKLAVRLYWMLRLQVNYAQLIQGSHAGQPGTFCGRG